MSGQDQLAVQELMEDGLVDIQARVTPKVTFQTYKPSKSHSEPRQHTQAGSPYALD